MDELSDHFIARWVVKASYFKLRNCIQKHELQMAAQSNYFFNSFFRLYKKPKNGVIARLNPINAFDIGEYIFFLSSALSSHVFVRCIVIK